MAWSGGCIPLKRFAHLALWAGPQILQGERPVPSVKQANSPLRRGTRNAPLVKADSLSWRAQPSARPVPLGQAPTAIILLVKFANLVVSAILVCAKCVWLARLRWRRRVAVATTAATVVRMAVAATAGTVAEKVQAAPAEVATVASPVLAHPTLLFFKAAWTAGPEPTQTQIGQSVWSARRANTLHRREREAVIHVRGAGNRRWTKCSAASAQRAASPWQGMPTARTVLGELIRRKKVTNVPSATLEKLLQVDFRNASTAGTTISQILLRTTACLVPLANTKRLQQTQRAPPVLTGKFPKKDKLARNARREHTQIQITLLVSCAQQERSRQSLENRNAMHVQRGRWPLPILMRTPPLALAQEAMAQEAMAQAVEAMAANRQAMEANRQAMEASTTDDSSWLIVRIACVRLAPLVAYPAAMVPARSVRQASLLERKPPPAQPARPGPTPTPRESAHRSSA